MTAHSAKISSLNSIFASTADDPSCDEGFRAEPEKQTVNLCAITTATTVTATEHIQHYVHRGIFLMCRNAPKSRTIFWRRRKWKAKKILGSQNMSISLEELFLHLCKIRTMHETLQHVFLTHCLDSSLGHAGLFSNAECFALFLMTASQSNGYQQWSNFDKNACSLSHSNCVMKYGSAIDGWWWLVNS